MVFIALHITHYVIISQRPCLSELSIIQTNRKKTNGSVHDTNQKKKHFNQRHWFTNTFFSMEFKFYWHEKQTANDLQPMIKRFDKFVYFQCHVTHWSQWTFRTIWTFRVNFCLFIFQFLCYERAYDDGIPHTCWLTKFAIFIQIELSRIYFWFRGDHNWCDSFCIMAFFLYLLSFSIKLKNRKFIFASSSFLEHAFSKYKFYFSWQTRTWTFPLFILQLTFSIRLIEI